MYGSLHPIVATIDGSQSGSTDTVIAVDLDLDLPHLTGDECHQESQMQTTNLISALQLKMHSVGLLSANAIMLSHCS